MKCANCGAIESKVIDSRPTEDSSAIKRRRECLSCHFRFTTFERIEVASFAVIKKDLTREQYDREKLIRGIMKSCERRPVTMSQIQKMVSEIENNIIQSGKNEVLSTSIGEEVMQALKSIDEVAYVRFASVYRQFKDINTFMDELKTLLDERK